MHDRHLAGGGLWRKFRQFEVEDGDDEGDDVDDEEVDDEEVLDDDSDVFAGAASLEDALVDDAVEESLELPELAGAPDLSALRLSVR